MNRRMRRIRTILLLSAAASIALVMVGAQAADLLHRADLSSVNTALLGPRDRRTPPPVVIVSIEDRTLTGTDADGNPRSWPMDRRRHAKVIDELHEAGAKVIAYDVQFTEPQRRPEEDIEADNALIEAVRAAAPTVVMADDRGRRERRDVRLRRRRGARVQQGDGRQLQLLRRRRRPDPPDGVQDRRR